MQYTAHYDSPLGGILLSADNDGLTGLWFDGAKYFAAGLNPDHREGSLPVLDETRRRLDVYSPALSRRLGQKMRPSLPGGRGHDRFYRAAQRNIMVPI